MEMITPRWWFQILFPDGLVQPTVPEWLLHLSKGMGDWGKGAKGWGGDMSGLAICGEKFVIFSDGSGA